MLLRANAITWVNPRTSEAILVEYHDQPGRRKLFIESTARPGKPIEVDADCQPELIQAMENCLADRARQQEG